MSTPHAASVRAEMRRAMRCPCDGAPVEPGVVSTPRAQPAVAGLDLVERVTGVRPLECPWRGFYDADVAAVQDAHGYRESGQLREFWGDDPPAWLVEAEGIYHRALERTRFDAADTRRKALEVEAAQRRAAGASQ
jgi:hypothetical protein